MPTERKHREEIVRYGRMLHEHGFVAAMDGNLSVRLGGDRVLVTPTCVSKGAMRATDMVIVDLDGQQVAGRRNVTSEIGMHLLIYRTRPDIQAIVHAHPPTATGFAAAGIPLTEPLVCEVVMGLGCIPLARYGTPGTSELAQTLEPYVPGYDAILMSNHGVVTYGDTLEHAYMKMETVEHFAQIALVTHLLGRQQPLKEVEIEKLLMARTKYFGAKIAACMPLPRRAPKSQLASGSESPPWLCENAARTSAPAGFPAFFFFFFFFPPAFLRGASSPAILLRCEI